MFPGWLSGKESTCQSVRHGFDPGAGKIRYRRKWQPTPVFLPLKSHGQRSLAVAKTRTWLSDWVCAQTYTFPVYVTRRRLPSRAQEWALVHHSEMNCWRRHMGWQSKRLHWEGEPRRMALPPGSWSWVLRCWGYLPGCLWPITDSGSCLVVHPSLSQDGFQQGGFWEVGR